VRADDDPFGTQYDHEMKMRYDHSYRVQFEEEPMEDPAMEVKQVILMRTDLQMRKGKMVAQGAHASMKFLLDRFQYDTTRISDIALSGYLLNDAEYKWLQGLFTKVCLRVDSQEQLVDIVGQAAERGLTVHLITDSGKTEFHGVPTITCAAIGPDYVGNIDPLTGHLKTL
jgi:PTH2 family peptidyl-tRNA hydrolase